MLTILSFIVILQPVNDNEVKECFDAHDFELYRNLIVESYLCPLLHSFDAHDFELYRNFHSVGNSVTPHL